MFNLLRHYFKNKQIRFSRLKSNGMLYMNSPVISVLYRIVQSTFLILLLFNLMNRLRRHRQFEAFRLTKARAHVL